MPEEISRSDDSHLQETAKNEIDSVAGGVEPTQKGRVLVIQASPADLLTEWNRRKREEKYRFYVPHPKQLTFHESQARVRAIFGGNRSGKTEAGAVECVWHATGDYPEWYPAEGRVSQPSKGRIIVTDYAKGMGEVVQEKLATFLPWQKKTQTHKTQGGVITKYILPNGSTIDVLTHDSSEEGKQRHEGVALDYVWIDEPCARWIYIAARRGCVDRGGRVWFTLTPLTQPWLHDEIFLPGQEPGGNIFSMVQSIWDNPHIKREEILEFESSLDEDEKEARLSGRFVFLAGLIYKMLNAGAHMADASDDLPKDAAYWMVLDPHDRRPSAFAWFHRDETGSVEFFDEMWIEDKTIKEYVELIAAKEELWGIAGKVSRVIDPLFGNKQYGNTKRTVKDEYRRAGIDIAYPMSFRDANNDIAYGHGLVKEYLRYDKTKPIGVENHPKLTIRRNCKMTWFQMNRYIWDDYKGRASEDREAKDAPKDKYKDFPDCIRYGVAAVHRHGVFAEPPKVERSRMADYERGKTGHRLASSWRNKR